VSPLALAMVATQNYTAILRPLQWLTIALIFLFFLRVIRAVWVEIRPAGPRTSRGERRRGEPDAPRASGRHGGLQLKVLEPPEQQGQVYAPADELTVGRGSGCGISTEYDVYSSSLHARFVRDGDHLLVEDLGSTNGTYVNSERITAPTRLSKNDLVQIGATVFEVDR
jgi:hypothetical protein